MEPWDLFKPLRYDPLTKKASPEEMHMYTSEVEEYMIAEVRQRAIELMENLKGSHHESLWPSLEERCQELAEDRIETLKMFFRKKRTGSPFEPPRSAKEKGGTK